MKSSLTTRSQGGILQKYIQTKSGLPSVSPGDCKQISIFIEKITGKVVSETTLKRFFGFARQEFNFSLYTLNTLSEYAGFESWDHFCQTITNHGELSSGHTMWEEFRQKALIVSRITHTTLRNLSGVPFELTVSRSSTEVDFEFFLESDFQFYCLTGTPGVGKTVQMTHLVQSFFLGDEAPYRDSIVWFLKGGAQKELIPSEIDLAKSMQEQLGPGKKFNFLEHFRQHPSEVKGKLVLMVDGFDEHIYDISELDNVFQKVTDLLGYFRGLGWLKIVFSLRTSTWRLLQERISQSESLIQTWFSGVFYQKEVKSNIAPLNPKEVSLVLKGIQGQSGVVLKESDELLDLFGYPFYIYLYTQLLKKVPFVQLKANALYCELVASCVLHKIHHSRYSVEMLVLLRRLVGLMDYGKSTEPIEKRLLLEGHDAYLLGYQELVREGILQEVDNDKIFAFRTYVQFIQEPLYRYFVAMSLIEEAPELSGLQLFQQVMREYPNESLRKALIKWILWYKMLKEPGEITEMISHHLLSPDEKGDLLVFICEILQHHSVDLEAAQRKDLITKGIDFFASYFLVLENLGDRHREALHTLLNYAVDPLDQANLLILQTLLGIAFLDRYEISRAMAALQKLDHQIFTERYPFNPLAGLEYILRFYSQQPNSPAFPAALLEFIKHPPARNKGKLPEPEQVIAYQLGAFVLALRRSHRELIELTATIQRLHPELFSRQYCGGTAMFLMLRQAFSALRTHRTAQADQTVEQLKKCYLLSEENRNAHTVGLYDILKGELAITRGDYTEAVRYFSKAYHSARDANFVMLQLYAAMPLIRTYKSRHDYNGTLNILDELRVRVRDLTFPVEELFLKKIMEEV